MSKLRVFVLTCMEKGHVTDCLPQLTHSSQIEVVGVIRAIGAGTSKWRFLKRRIIKIAKIGLLGALNGIRMRAWYAEQDEEVVDIRTLCEKNKIPFYTIMGLNSAQMVELIKSFSVDLGISLGNGYISPRVFELPRYGMINLHSEILPKYQNAQSIIWPIYCRDPYTGFTIHRIAKKIDAGDILYQKKIPLIFAKTLEQTVRLNKKRVDQLIPAAMLSVCEKFGEYLAHAESQHNGQTFTTPSLFQFIRMVWNNAVFYKKQVKLNKVAK